MQYFSKNVVFIRHGETEWNVQDRMQGHLNSPLTKRGVSQAREAIEKLAKYKFDIIVSSHLGRAFETAKIIAERLDITEIMTDNCLLERNLGNLQGNTVAEAKVKFPYLWGSNGKFISDANIPNGESLKDFLIRVGKAIENLKNLSQGKNILVVTHEGVLNAIVSHLKNIEFADVRKSYHFKNCDPVVIS